MLDTGASTGICAFTSASTSTSTSASADALVSACEQAPQAKLQGTAATALADDLIVAWRRAVLGI